MKPLILVVLMLSGCVDAHECKDACAPRPVERTDGYALCVCAKGSVESHFDERPTAVLDAGAEAAAITQGLPRRAQQEGRGIPAVGN